MNNIRFILICFFLFLSSEIYSQNWYVRKENQQKQFDSQVPYGNYSGIYHVIADKYVVVNDKSDVDGFCNFLISIDSISGDILNVRYLGFVCSGQPNRDGEGIAFLSKDSTILIAGEADNKIKEYRSNGTLTGREIVLRPAKGDLGYESLTYNSCTHTLWTANESTFPEDGVQAMPNSNVENIIRLQSFNDSLKPKLTYFYKMDKPSAVGKAWRYAIGVSELTAMDDGTILVLEREFFVPTSKLGAFVNCKIYQVKPEESTNINTLKKYLLYEWKTKFDLFNYSIANYEGMCVGPKLKDGSQVIILISDSQNHYGGLLKDWFKTIVISR